MNIAQLRFHNQFIASPLFGRVSDVVSWLGAVQAQDYLGALWALGLRTKHGREQAVEQALADRSIVRTWPMRGTLHFVPAADVRWMLKLLTPRVIAGAASRYRQLELDETTFSRSRQVIVRALEGGKAMDRAELRQALESAHISTAGQRGIHILGRLAQDGLICFGARSGKQQTFVLLDEWVPNSRRLERDEALAELTRRYFSGHGPATLQDFVWWSGLSVASAREGLELVKSHLVQEEIGGQHYWLSASSTAPKASAHRAHLLPGFDEYLVGYRDRSAVVDPAYLKQINGGGGLLNPAIVINGRVLGTWKRTLLKDSVVITPRWFAPATKSSERALVNAARQYGEFLGLEAAVM